MTSPETVRQIKNGLQWADVIVIGPGMGTTATAEWLLEIVLTESDLPLIIDADGLTILAKNQDLQRQVAEQKKRSIILTPHPGELARFSVNGTAEAGRGLAEKLHCIVAAKDARTRIYAADREDVYMNLTGNSGMATAGSGDVLTGIIGGLAAQKMEAYEAACAGVYLHGLAGDLAADRNTEYGLLATDIIAALKALV